MLSKKEIEIEEFDWQSFWEAPIGLSEEDEREFRKLFKTDRNSLRVPFGPMDGSGNWANE